MFYAEHLSCPSEAYLDLVRNKQYSKLVTGFFQLFYVSVWGNDVARVGLYRFDDHERCVFRRVYVLENLLLDEVTGTVYPTARILQLERASVAVCVRNFGY